MLKTIIRPISSILSGKEFALAALLALTTVSTRAATYEYDWTGGEPGFTGQIFLDAPSSAAGTLADIVSISIGGGFAVPYDPAHAFLADPIFKWTPTQITRFHVDWTDALDENQVQVGEDANGSGFNLLIINNWPHSTSLDTTGSWLAVNSTVPDGGGTGAMVIISLTALGAVSLRFRPALG